MCLAIAGDLQRVLKLLSQHVREVRFSSYPSTQKKDLKASVKTTRELVWERNLAGYRPQDSRVGRQCPREEPDDFDTVGHLDGF